MYTHEETLELLQRAVAEKGDGHVYEKHNDGGATCRYANPDGTPDCLVGHAFSYVGLLHLGTEEGSTVSFLRRLANFFTSAAIAALEVAQARQDDGQTWGEALIAAKEVRP